MGVPTPFPSDAAIKRAEALTRERFVLDGEDKQTELAPGTVRRRALDAALIDVAAKLPVPSLQWRQDYSLLLGLERVLSDDEPKLADGTVLSAHQVDALSGTLTALLAQSQAVEASGAGTEADADDADADTDADGSNAEAGGSYGADSPSGGTGTVAALLMDEPLRHEPDSDEPDSDEPDDEDDNFEDDELDAEDLSPEYADDIDEEFEVAPPELEDEEDDEDDIDEPDEDEEDEENEPGIPDEIDDETGEGELEEGSELDEDVQLEALGDDPGADRRFWFEHATGAGKTVAALGFVEASRTGGVLILTHRRNLVDQFIGELKDRGYRDRLCKPLLIGEDAANGPVSVETYQWFVRNAGRISSAYTIVICDEAHTALGEKTSAAIRKWHQPIWIGMTATGALIARHVTDLFPTQTSRFDLAQAARRGVIAPLRCIRIPPGPGVRTIAKVPLRRGEVDTEFDQEMLAGVLDHLPFNIAIADLYKTRFNGVPGVVYAAGVRHAYNVAESFRALGMKAMAVSGETPKRELAQILADYESGKIDVLVNAQLLAEGWNSPRATVCMHLAPTASKRIYQQRVGRVTRRHPGKEAGIVIDFVHPATQHDDPVVTLHSLLDRDVYRGGAIVVGPVRRGRGRRVRVERRVLPVTPDSERRAEVFERELWRIAVEHLDYGEQRVWAALAGARVAPNGWRRAKAMLHFDRQGELKSRFLLTALQRNRSGQVRLRALQEIAAGRDADAFDSAIDIMAPWPRDERREGVKIMLLALAEKRIGRRDQASNWIWRMAEYTREVHEEYAVQRWPETKRLLGLLVNSSGTAHARNARRIVHATRKQDRRLSAALLAAAVAHTPEAAEALNGARARMARKPATLARDLLRNFPKGKRSKNRKRTRKPVNGVSAAPAGAASNGAATSTEALPEAPELVLDGTASIDGAAASSNGHGAASEATVESGGAPDSDDEQPRTVVRRTRRRRNGSKPTEGAAAETESKSEIESKPDAAPAATEGASEPAKAEIATEAATPAPAVKPKPVRRTRGKSATASTDQLKLDVTPDSDAQTSPTSAKAKNGAVKKPATTKPRRTRTTAKPAAAVDESDSPRAPEPV